MDEETKKRIAEIRAREQRATTGPWEHDEERGGFWSRVDEIERIGVVNTSLYPGQGPMMFTSKPNAEFIANARQDVPFLLDALEKAHTEIKRLRDLNDEFVESRLERD